MEINKIRSIAITVFLIFFFLFIYTKLAGPIPFSVNNVNTNKSEAFSVQGTGKAAAVPDRARLTLGVSESASNVSQAQEKLNAKTKNITSALEALGVKNENIRTVNYSISPEYSSNQRVSSYNVTQSLEISSPIDLVNNVIDEGVANGANLSSGIEFILDDERQEELEASARKEAIDNAKRKAKSIADISGIRLGRIINIQESNNSFPRPLMLDAKNVAEDLTQTETVVEPGENRVEITVTVSFETN